MINILSFIGFYDWCGEENLDEERDCDKGLRVRKLI